MLDYINDKEFIHVNDEDAIILSILYFYIGEKIFTKKNIQEFILFIVQLFIRYIFTHTFHEIYLNNQHIITDNLLLLQNIKH